MCRGDRENLAVISADKYRNLQNDSFHTYSWDAGNKLTAVDTVGLTFDAPGRMVEQARGASYTEIVYAPTGYKLALMNGQTLQKAFCPLPGGGTAVYTSSGLAYYRHADWLGSSRFASTPSRTKYFDVAYASYGEDYVDSGTVDLNFTGQNQDTVSGVYDFIYREYHANSGRWIQPDPAGTAVADPAYPQSWNRYAYISNMPPNDTDYLGLLGTMSDAGGYLRAMAHTTGFYRRFEFFSIYRLESNGERLVRVEWLGLVGLYLDSFQVVQPANNGRSCLAGAGPLAVGQSRCTDPCSNSILTAAGVDARQQIATAQTYIGWSRYFGYGDLIGYANAVHNGGPNDIKDLPGHSRTNKNDVAAGNISFGITCPFGAGFCQFAAGLAQTLSGHPDFSGTLATGFDTPSDNAAIQVGQAMRVAGCHE